MNELYGTQIVVTRASHQAGELTEALEERGADVVELPAIEIVDPDDGGSALRDAFANIEQYQWVIVTSVNTVSYIRSLITDAARSLRWAAIGPATASALEECGLRVEMVPEKYVAESLLEAFPVGTGRVLLPRAAVAREVLPEGLRDKGWTVDVVTAYKTVAADPTAHAKETLQTADIITFTASSTVENFVEAYGPADIPDLVACIGPITAATATGYGLPVAVVAKEHTIPGLVNAVVAEVISRR